MIKLTVNSTTSNHCGTIIHKEVYSSSNHRPHHHMIIQKEGQAFGLLLNRKNHSAIGSVVGVIGGVFLEVIGHSTIQY